MERARAFKEMGYRKFTLKLGNFLHSLVAKRCKPAEEENLCGFIIKASKSMNSIENKLKIIIERAQTMGRELDNKKVWRPLTDSKGRVCESERETWEGV